MEQEVAAEEIPEGARKRKLDWAELIENENQQVRDQLTNMTISRFRTLYESMKIVYKELHGLTAQTLVSLPNSSGADIVDGRKDVHDAIERVLTPSFDYLDRVNNAEMTRVANLLADLA